MQLDERYEIIDAHHGEGGFGRVSKQRDKVLERFVAVKQMRLLDSPEGVVKGVCASTNWQVIVGESPIQGRSSEPS